MSSSSSSTPFKPSVKMSKPRVWLPPVQIAVGEPKAPSDLLSNLKGLAMAARGKTAETHDIHYHFCQKFSQVKEAVRDNEANLILFLDDGDKSCLDIINKAKSKGIPWLFLEKKDFLDVNGYESERVCCVRRDYFFTLTTEMETIRDKACELCGIQSIVEQL